MGAYMNWYRTPRLYLTPFLLGLQLGFEGETDGYFSGDIAIDDISIKHGRCQR